MKTRSIFILMLTTAIAGCNQKTVLTVSPSSISLYYEGTRQLNVESSETVIYESSNTFHALVDETGLVTGNKIGTADIVVKAGEKSVSVPVTVKPRYILYDDMTKYIDQPLSAITASFGTADKKTQKGCETLYSYIGLSDYAAGVVFKLENDVCSSVYVYVSTSYVTKLTKYLIERYLFLETMNDVYYLMDESASTLIVYCVVNTSLLGVSYNSTKTIEETKSNQYESWQKLLEDLRNCQDFVSFTGSNNDCQSCPKIKMP